MSKHYALVEQSTRLWDGFYLYVETAREVQAFFNEYHPWGIWLVHEADSVAELPCGKEPPRFHRPMLTDLPLGVTDLAQVREHIERRKVAAGCNNSVFV